MRIISGKRKGKIINPPRNLPVRPTTDKAKESLFNILNNLIWFEGKQVLDLFAGTGNISLEFYSRGCEFVTAIDIDKNCIRFIDKTAKSLEFENLTAVQSDYKRYLNNTSLSFDIIFADPPYDMEGLKQLPDLILENNILNPEGIIIIEHPGDYDFSDHPNFSDHRTYGRVNFSFFG